jgi:outer membrane lipoprotein-sorting protein
LSATPLDLILANDIDLRHNNSIVAVRHEAGALIVDARTSTNRSKPNLSLVFADSELELRQWTIIDDQGLTTTVALRDLEPGVIVDAKLFVLKDARAPVGVKSRD